MEPSRLQVSNKDRRSRRQDLKRVAGIPLRPQQNTDGSNEEGDDVNHYDTDTGDGEDEVDGVFGETVDDELYYTPRRHDDDEDEQDKADSGDRIRRGDDGGSYGSFGYETINHSNIDADADVLLSQDLPDSFEDLQTYDPEPPPQFQSQSQSQSQPRLAPQHAAALGEGTRKDSQSHHLQKPPVHMTISEDRSEGSEFERRMLIALERPQAKKIHATSQSPAPVVVPSLAPQNDLANSYGKAGQRNSHIYGHLLATTGQPGPPNHGLQDYQMQLMLLEQQNKKRLMMARQDRENDTANKTFQSTTMTTTPSLADKAYEIRSTTNFSSSSTMNVNPNSAPGGHPGARLRPPRLIDIDALGIPEEAATSFEALQAYMAALREVRQPRASRLKVIHRIESSKGPQLYFDHPHWTFGENGSRTLTSSLAVSNISTYLEKRVDIAFVVYRNYDPQVMKAPDVTDDESGTLQPVEHTSETIEPATADLGKAITKLLTYNANPTAREELAGDTIKPKSLHSPYLPIYHCRGTMDDFLHALPAEQQRQFQILLDYVLPQYANEYKDVDALLCKNKITYRYVEYLFKPGDLLVEGKGHKARAYLCTSWLHKSPRYEPSTSFRLSSKAEKWVINGEHWDFDGSFSRRVKELSVELNPDDATELLIEELAVKPLKFFPEVADRLRRRGEMFWKCRFRHFVSYHEDAARDSHHSGDERFMIDHTMYRELHQRENRSKMFHKEALDDDLRPEPMMEGKPPNSNFLYLLPLTIKGYSLKRKKWLDLEVDRISEVVWNKDAFESLVLDGKTKRLIRALVSNQLEAERSTDLISGKGNGLILLLHGGPGTGKTLTAESVAEIAEKPLYPVTCGDIGTEPEMVETYLESVLNLGKTWGCVVLLDEADVFLEQRSLEDLQRNALVSVFLRVLEYYDGILVLTSNRVGTFDEAFKSRIQLALHYPNLSAYQRTQIWTNFISRLEKLEERDVDFKDLMGHVKVLAKHKMNGREIRNVITTARQYAKWERKTLNYELLNDIIETTGRFNAYIEKLNGGYTQDQLAEDEGLRLQEYAD